MRTAISRATTSVVPPAGLPTSMCSVAFGYLSWAEAVKAPKTSASVAVARSAVSMNFMRSPGFCLFRVGSAALADFDFLARPHLRLLTQAQPQAWPRRHQHAAVLDLQPL